MPLVHPVRGPSPLASEVPASRPPVAPPPAWPPLPPLPPAPVPPSGPVTPKLSASVPQPLGNIATLAVAVPSTLPAARATTVTSRRLPSGYPVPLGKSTSIEPLVSPGLCGREVVLGAPPSTLTSTSTSSAALVVASNVTVTRTVPALHELVLRQPAAVTSPASSMIARACPDDNHQGRRFNFRSPFRCWRWRGQFRSARSAAPRSRRPRRRRRRPPRTRSSWSPNRWSPAVRRSG